MADKIKSVFGNYADRLQVMIDSSLDLFAPTWFQKYFTWGTPQTTLNYVSVIGKSRIEAAASVVDRDAPAPLRSRPGLDKLTGEIPAISEKFKMTEQDYYDFLTLQSLQAVDDATKKQQLLDLMFGDVRKAAMAPLKRLDIMCLQAISSGVISINTTTNPDGLAMADVDLLMPSGNKVNASVNWNSSPSTAKPLTVDFPGIIAAGLARGIKFEKILMTRAKWYKFIAITEVINFVSNFLGRKQAGQTLVTLDNVNQILVANMMPVIEIVDESIGIEKDGVITASNPFTDSNAVFIPTGTLGTIKNTVAIEQIQPVAKVNYATYQKVLVSKWAENDPFGEWTKGYLNAFPSFEAIDSVYLLSTTIAF
jgi:hypothetical protein